MRRALRTQEEILARKLLNFLGGCAALIVFAGIVFHLASTPPGALPAAAPPSAAGSAETSEDVAAAFNDRLARVRLGSAPLPERLREAESLLARAPTPTIRRQVEALLQELSQEADAAAIDAFNSLRQQNAALAAENRFDAIDAALAKFQAENPRLAELVNGERRLLAKRRDAAFAMKEAVAHAAIARGDVAAAARLAEEARPLVSPDEAVLIDTWVSQAETRRGGAPDTAPSAETGPDIAAAPLRPVEPDKPDETPVEPSETDAQPWEPEPRPASPEEPAAPFAGIVTAGLSGTFVIPEERSAAMVNAAGATICADTLVPEQDLVEHLTRGSPLWILGVPVQKRGMTAEFGGETVQRTIEKARVGIAGRDFLPDLAWEDPACKGRRWLFGTVELAYPVLRVTVEGATYTLDTAAPLPRIVRRAKTTTLPALTEGAGVWVKGLRRGTAITAEELTVLAPELAGDEAYKALFSN